MKVKNENFISNIAMSTLKSFYEDRVFACLVIKTYFLVFLSNNHCSWHILDC